MKIKINYNGGGLPSMSKNAIINQQNDYDVQESLLEDEILLEVGNLEKLKEEQAKIGTPDSMGKMLMDTVWEQFELQIAAQAGDEFIKKNNGQTLDLRDSAHIQTAENFEKGKIATHNTSIDYQKRHDDWQSNFERDENGQIKYHTTRSGRQEANLVKGARKDFDQGRPSGSVSKGTDMDHTVSAGEMMRRSDVNAYMSKKEQVEFANSEENLHEMPASWNRSKGDTPTKEWVKNPNSKGKTPRETFNDLTEENEKELLEVDKKARKALDKRIEQGKKEAEETGRKSQREEAERAGKAAVKAIAINLLKDLLKKIVNKFVAWLKLEDRCISTLLSFMKEAFQNFINDFRHNVLSTVKTSLITVGEMLFGPIVRTITKIWSMAKKGWTSLKQAYNYITDKNNKYKPISILIMEVAKIFIAAGSGIGSVALGGTIEAFLMTIPGFAIEIPLFGSIASIVGLFMGALVSGIIGGIILNFLNRFIQKKLKKMASEQAVKQGGVVLRKQGQLLNLNENRLAEEQKKSSVEIKERHKGSAELQKNIISCVRNNEDIIAANTDSIAKHKTKNLSEKFNELNNTLDDLLKG